MALVASSAAAPADLFDFFLFVCLKAVGSPDVPAPKARVGLGHLGTLCRDQDERSHPGWARKQCTAVPRVRLLVTTP